MKLRFSLYLLFLLALLGLWSCNSKKEGKSGDEFESAAKSLGEEIKGIVYDGVPPPSEIPYLLMATGAEYNPTLTNDRKKWESYAQSEKATVNLGVYAADIGYLISYEKTQESLDYLGTCKSLADKLGLSSSLPPEILNSFEKNIGNRDSLAKILDGSMRRIGEFLKTDNQSKTAALIVTGSFVESLYLSTAIVKTYPTTGLTNDQRTSVLTKLIDVILKQEKSVAEVNKMLAGVDQTGLVPTLLADFKTLQANYAALKIDERMKANKGGLVFKPEELAGISTTIEKIRSEIVQ